MIGHVLFLLQVLFPISYACTGFTGSIGQVYPLEDPKVVLGDIYKLTCVLDPGSSVEFTANDLFFTIGDKPLSDVLIDGTWNVTALNDSAVELSVNDSSPYPGARYVYYCRAKSSMVTKERTVCMRYVYVGLPPSNVTDFKCISENLDSLTCTWVVTPNPIKANYDLYYKSEGNCESCSPTEDKVNVSQPICFSHDHFCPAKPGLLCSNYLTVNGSRVSCIIASESLTSRPEAIRNYTLRYSIKDPLVRYSQILGQYDCKEEDFRNLNCEVQRFRNCGEVAQPEGVECQTAPRVVRKDTTITAESMDLLRNNKGEVWLLSRNTRQSCCSSVKLRFNWTDIVRPAPVENVEVTALGPRSTQVSFSIPFNMYSLPK